MVGRKTGQGRLEHPERLRDFQGGIGPGRRVDKIGVLIERHKFGKLGPAELIKGEIAPDTEQPSSKCRFRAPLGQPAISMDERFLSQVTRIFRRMRQSQQVAIDPILVAGHQLRERRSTAALSALDALLIVEMAVDSHCSV